METLTPTPLKIKASKEFTNGKVYALWSEDHYPIEVTDTFLPVYTKYCIGSHQNSLKTHEVGDRSQRWMIGVSCMSGCPVRCKFCATGMLKKWRPLTAEEIVAQVDFILERNEANPNDSHEFKINYTRMGEPFLNMDHIRRAIDMIDERYPETHHYLSTIGVRGSDFSWVKNNITLQVSLHSLDPQRRRELIPSPRLMTLDELGRIRTGSKLKTTLNLTLVDEKDFDINILLEHFDPNHFFIKLSPINENEFSRENKMGAGIIEGANLI